MVGRAARGLWLHAFKAHNLQIQLTDEHIHHPDRVVLGDVVFQTLGEQRALEPILAFDESLHGVLASLRQCNFTAVIFQCLFTQPRPKGDRNANMHLTPKIRYDHA